MSEYLWTDARSDAVGLFNSSPRPEDEAAILDAFMRDPVAVLATINAVGEGYERGEVRYPWGLLRARVERKAAAEVTATAGKTQAKRVAEAEQWLRRTGLHFDRPEQVLAELFEHGGERGGAILKPYAEDEDLRERMVVLWAELRPKAQTLEHEELARAERWKAAHPKPDTRRGTGRAASPPLPPLRNEPVPNPLL